MSKELGTLVIVVLKAQHLIDNHTFYKQDPYVKLSLSGATKQTPVDPKGGQHPVWDAEIRFPISKELSKNNRTLNVSVFSEEKKEDELLGEAALDITDTLKSGEFDDWVPLSLKGTQRGDVYLEMTFFAAGPSPLTRRPSKFTNPTERLARPQQPPAQRPQRVVPQPQPSALSPGGQGSRISPHDALRQGRPRMQQVPLPGPWPGQSAQQHQQAQSAGPNHPNRRSSRSEDAPLPPLPQDAAEPTGEFVPSILRPGGPPRKTPSPSYANGTAGPHHITPSGTDANAYPPRPHVIHQSTPSFPAPRANIRSSPPRTQPHVHQVSSYPTQGTQEHVGLPSGGYATTQPSPQAQPELTHGPYDSQSQPPPQPWQQVQHSLRQQAQSPLGKHGGHASPRAPDGHPAQPYAVPSGPTLPGQPYVTTSSTAPSSHSYIRPQTAPPPTLSHIATPVLHAQPYAASSSPVVSARPQVASSTSGPSIPPTQHYLPASSSIPPTQTYAAPPAHHAQPYTTPMNGVPPTQPYVSPASSVLSPHIGPPSHPTSPSPPVQSYISPPNPTFPLPTSPPPMSPYGPSYAPAHAPSFPAPSFPVPQATADYFETPNASPFSPHDETNLPDPYLLRRYQTPLPLPGGPSQPQGSAPNARPKPRPSPPAAAAPAPAPVPMSTLRNEYEDVNERAARELQRSEEESVRARREQEERDAELARTLDLELNADAESAPQDYRDRPSQPPPLRAGAGNDPDDW